MCEGCSYRQQLAVRRHVYGCRQGASLAVQRTLSCARRLNTSGDRWSSALCRSATVQSRSLRLPRRVRAQSRSFVAIFRRVRISQLCFALSGAFGPTITPAFQAWRGDAECAVVIAFSHMGKPHPAAVYQKLALPLLPAPRIGSIPKRLGLW